MQASALDEIAHAHAAVGGTARGRRYTTQQINRVYVLLVASKFQGFCRDLHSECVDHLVAIINPPAPMRQLVRLEFGRGRQLDRGNAQSGSIGADFDRLGIRFWDELNGYNAATPSWRGDMDTLNHWRNAIAHEDFTSPRLGGIMNLRLAQVRLWRQSCGRLARAMDEVMRQHLRTLTGVAPW